MIATATDGLTRRRGARMEREKNKSDRRDGDKTLNDMVLPIPMVAVAMSGAIFVLASLFVVYYHLYHVDDDEEWMKNKDRMNPFVI